MLSDAAEMICKQSLMVSRGNQPNARSLPPPAPVFLGTYPDCSPTPFTMIIIMTMMMMTTDKNEAMITRVVASPPVPS